MGSTGGAFSSFHSFRGSTKGGLYTSPFIPDVHARLLPAWGSGGLFWRARSALPTCSPGAVPAGTPEGGGRGGEGEYRGRAARHVPRRRRRALLLVEAAANERRRLFAPEGG